MSRRYSEMMFGGQLETTPAKQDVSIGRKEEEDGEEMKILMARIARLSAKAEERLKACADDQNANTTMCSAKVAGLAREEVHRSEAASVQPRSNLEAEAPMTDAGKKVESAIDEKCGHFRPRLAAGRRKRKAKKKERLRYEKLLRRYSCELRSDDPMMREAGLLLAYACERSALDPRSLNQFRRFLMSSVSRKLFTSLFWFVHCRFLKENSETEQLGLLAEAADLYVELLSSVNRKDFFFTHYPCVVSFALFFGFYYFSPGSRSLYAAPSFKNILYLVIARVLTGTDVTPSSVNILRLHCFPDDDDDDSDDDDNDESAPSAALLGSAADDTGEVQEQRKRDDPDALPPLLVAPHLLENRDKLLSRSRSSTSLLAKRTDPTCQVDATRHEKSAPSLASHPTANFVGSRKDLRFRPQAPENLQALLPRQQKVPFDASQISPLVQQYLSKFTGEEKRGEKTIGRDQKQRKNNTIKRTRPVHWCHTGGTDTFVKCGCSHSHEALQAAYRESQMKYKKDLIELRREYKRQMSEIEAERRRIQQGGSVSISRFAVDRILKSY